MNSFEEFLCNFLSSEIGKIQIISTNIYQQWTVGRCYKIDIEILNEHHGVQNVTTVTIKIFYWNFYNQECCIYFNKPPLCTFYRPKRDVRIPCFISGPGKSIWISITQTSVGSIWFHSHTKSEIWLMPVWRQAEQQNGQSKDTNSMHPEISSLQPCI